jgi:hypothetical protein
MMVDAEEWKKENCKSDEEEDAADEEALSDD